jgi:hypothetical protein
LEPRLKSEPSNKTLQPTIGAASVTAFLTVALAPLAVER